MIGKMFQILFPFIIIIKLGFSRSSKDFGQNLGLEAAEKLATAAARNVDEIKKAVEEASSKLSNSINGGVDATKEAVKEMSGLVSELAKKIDVKVNSADLANIGKAASENFRDAVDRLSQNWKLAVDTADLKDAGAEAAKHLSKAIQNEGQGNEQKEGLQMTTVTKKMKNGEPNRVDHSSLAGISVHDYNDPPIDSMYEVQVVETGHHARNNQRISFGGFNGQQFNHLHRFWNRGEQ